MSEVLDQFRAAAEPLFQWWKTVRLDPMLILAFLGLNVVVAEILCRRTVLRVAGTAMTVLVTTAITANLGLVPTSTKDAPIYDGISEFVAPLCVFWILLGVNLRDILKAGGPMIFLFLVGSAGTCAGVVLAMWAVDGGSPKAFHELYRGVGATYVGTYVGGGGNFVGMAKHYGVDREEALYAGMAAVDNLYTLVWMGMTFLVPWGVRRLKSRRAPELRARTLISGIEEDTVAIHPLNLGLLMAAGCAAIWFSNATSRSFTEWLSWAISSADTVRRIEVPSILILTTLALGIAQVSSARRLFRGSQMAAMFAMYLFLAVIGAQCDAAAVAKIQGLAWTLVAFVGIVVFTHGLITFAAGRLFRIETDVAAIASQANIGGATTALALARALGRADLVLPGVLVGTLGYGLGNYLGIFVAEKLL
ncbi:MAG: DUF819 family protein [Planctomycetales bacterium]